MVENADHDGIDVARQHPRGIGDGLAAAELHLGAGQHDRFAAELSHADIERYPRAGRRLLEDHRQGLAFERLVRLGIWLFCAFSFAFIATLKSSIRRSSLVGEYR